MVNILLNLTGFTPITLAEMKQVRLMNRLDSKYIVDIRTLPSFFKNIEQIYDVQTSNDGKRFASYHTVYLDTKDYAMYNAHVTQRKVREKIRVRTYCDSNETFIEVKSKNNHSRTIKERIKIGISSDLANNCAVKDFISSLTPFKISDLKPMLEIDFYRITLVNKQKTERITIDYDLRFNNLETHNRYQIDHLAIIELKRDGHQCSPFKQKCLELSIRQSGFSKYCIGCALTNPDMRINNIKETINKILKHKNYAY